MALTVQNTTPPIFYNPKVDRTRDAVQNLSNYMSKQIEEIKSSGFSETSMVQVEGYNLLRLALQNFENTHKSSLDLPVSKIGKDLGIQLIELDALVDQWGNGRFNEGIVKTTKTLQRLAARLKIGIPNIRAISPTFTAEAREDRYISIRCVGVFPSPLSKQKEPKLVIGNKAFPLTEKTWGALYFSIPFKILFPETDYQSGKMQAADYTVRIPYPEEGFFGSFNKVLEFKGSVTLLPYFPGEIFVQNGDVERLIEKKAITSKQLSQTSRPYGFNGTKLNQPYTLSAEKDWEIDLGSSNFHVDENKGVLKKSKWILGEENHSQVTWLVSTHGYRPFNKSDTLSFHISAIASHAIKNPGLGMENDLFLRWGNKVVINPKNGQCSIVFTGIDKKEQTLTKDSFGKYCYCFVQEGKYVVVVKMPEQISTFDLNDLPTQSNL